MKETNSTGKNEHVSGVIMLIMDVLSLSGRGLQSKVLVGSSLECRLNLHQAWSPHVNCCEQSQLLLITYFSWESDKHVMVRSVGFTRSPSDGAHPKSSSQANSNAQLRCVSGHPIAYYLDMIASDSVVDFQQYVRW